MKALQNYFVFKKLVSFKTLVFELCCLKVKNLYVVVLTVGK